MSRVVSPASNGQSGEKWAGGFDGPSRIYRGTSDSALSEGNIIDQAVINDKSVRQVRAGAQTWGFAECDPAYNKEGQLPKSGELRTEVE